MKLLDISAFSAINAVMAEIRSTGCVLSGRLECYSCKKVSSDKRLAKKLQDKAQTSPPTILAVESSPSSNPFPISFLGDGTAKQPSFGSFDLTPLAIQPFAHPQGRPKAEPLEDRETWLNFIATLNLSFPDHDFSDMPLSYFWKEHPEVVKGVIHTRLLGFSHALQSFGAEGLEDSIWREIDQVMTLPECLFFSFNPPSTESPFENSIWSHVYFIYNPNPDVNKVVIFSLAAISDSMDELEGEDTMQEDEMFHEIPMDTRGYVRSSPASICNSRAGSQVSLPGLDIAPDDDCSSPTKLGYDALPFVLGDGMEFEM
eukprot:Sspe_Gene.54694::Locus_30156_Transcript_1_1_Confidence_1.000_Length_1083::g.54694::m.54694